MKVQALEPMQRRPCGGATLSFHETLCRIHSLLIHGGKKKPLIKLCAYALAVGIHAALLTEDSYFRLQAQPHLPMALTMAMYNSWVFVEHILEVVCSLQLCGMFLSESKAPCLNRRITEGLSEYYNSWDLIQFCFLLWFTQAGFCSWLM